MDMYEWIHCPKCDHEIEFSFEPPDFDVGLFGYAVEMWEKEYRTCKCDFTEDEVEALEQQARDKIEHYEPAGFD